MQYTTQAYREEMQLPFRGHSSVYAYIGLINNEAQRSAKITSSFSGDESQLYSDSSSSYAGITSTEDDGSVTFTFGDYYELNIAGLTMTFNTVPSSITVTNGDKTNIYGVDNAKFSFDDGYENCHYIKITPNSGKLSLKSILFGIGLQFTDKQIIATNRENIVNHISNELPKKSFVLTIDNRLHMFNKDNPYGYANFLQEKQEVTYEYGREMSDGSIYKIKGGKVLLSKWSSDDYNAKFTCVGYLDYMDGEFYKGRYYKDGISAYNLAVQVFEDAGLTNYRLDECLKKVAIFNPLPRCTHREALQMIANASRCVLYEDRDGNVCLMNANRPSFIGDVTFVGATDYSIPSAIFDDNSMYNYADAEHQYVKADGTLLFLPEEDSFRQVGFVSSEIANSNGQFTNNPHIDVTFLAEFRLRQLILNFAVVTPTSITVTCKHAGQVVNTQTITNIEIATIYTYNGIIDALSITFNSATPNQRIHLNNIQLNGVLDYKLTYRELKESPVAVSLEKVSKVNVHVYNYALEKTEEGTSRSSYVNVTTTPNEDGGDTTEITTGSSEYGSGIASIEAVVGDNLITLDSPYYDYKITDGIIKESGAYYLIVTSDKAQTIDIYGKPFSVTDNVYTLNIHEKGVEKKSSNPLICSMTMAKQQAEWLKGYYDDDLEYPLTYRGDPTLDADDLIYLDNRFVHNNEVRIEEESINTSMGMDFTCKLTVRRTSFKTNATTEQAIVGRFNVGEVLTDD